MQHLHCVPAAFVTKTLPLPRVPAAFVAQTLPLPRVPAAFVAKKAAFALADCPSVVSFKVGGQDVPAPASPELQVRLFKSTSFSCHVLMPTPLVFQKEAGIVLQALAWAQFPYGCDHVLEQAGYKITQGFDAVVLVKTSP